MHACIHTQAHTPWNTINQITDPVQPLVQRRQPADSRDLLQLEGEPHQRRHEVGAVRKVPVYACVCRGNRMDGWLDGWMDGGDDILISSERNRNAKRNANASANVPCPQRREAQRGAAPLPGQLLARRQQAHQVRALPLLLCLWREVDV